MLREKDIKLIRKTLIHNLPQLFKEIMPPPDFRLATRVNFMFCDLCKENIRKSFENTLYLKATQGPCYTRGYGHAIPANQILSSELHAWFSLEKDTWKFSNDTRRMILKKLDT